MSKIEVSLSPSLYPVYQNAESIVVVIDVLRASTAICTAFSHGAKAVWPVATVERARELKNEGYMAGAERDAKKIEGFDFGNSPYDYMDDEKLKGQTIVLTTTNGTHAIETARGAFKIVVGTFANISVLSKWLDKQDRDVLLLCSGWKDRFNLEDTVFAGALIKELTKNESFIISGDSALCVRYLYDMAQKDPIKFLSRSSHKRRLAELNMKKDIKYSLAVDTAPVIPLLKGNILENIVKKPIPVKVKKTF